MRLVLAFTTLYLLMMAYGDPALEAGVVGLTLWPLLAAFTRPLEETCP